MLIGNVEINPEYWATKTKDEFKKAFAGKLKTDISEVWKEVSKHKPKQVKKKASKPEKE